MLQILYNVQNSQNSSIKNYMRNKNRRSSCNRFPNMSLSQRAQLINQMSDKIQFALTIYQAVLIFVSVTHF